MAAFVVSVSETSIHSFAHYLPSASNGFARCKCKLTSTHSLAHYLLNAAEISTAIAQLVAHPCLFGAPTMGLLPFASNGYIRGKCK